MYYENDTGELSVDEKDWTLVVGGVQYLKDGKKLVSVGALGQLLVLDSTGKVIWKYINPETWAKESGAVSAPLAQGSAPKFHPSNFYLYNWFQKSTFYPVTFEGFNGKDFDAPIPVETYSKGVTFETYDSTRTVGLIESNSTNPFGEDGYILYAPKSSQKVFLIDKNGKRLRNGI